MFIVFLSFVGMIFLILDEDNSNGVGSGNAGFKLDPIWAKHLDSFQTYINENPAFYGL